MRHLYDNLSVIGAAAEEFFLLSLVSWVLLGWSRAMLSKVISRLGIFQNLSKIFVSRILKRIKSSKVLHSIFQKLNQT
jgi:uncharacterized membrane protein